ncbi:CRS2-associated factor 1, chloroplastic-like [Salvia splendens]|uniref:CRS2-associated factor 1, chloroplastic-like n=1 Tax=Salvia splendens TaxID=180675 RepID=UPI001C260042|nr:CRS2-associated factor 1, chloroplastic-like [Salvia splendens]
MAVKTHFPVFAPPQLRPHPHRPATEIRFSRWNNANARKFTRRERSQKEIEDELRLEKRFDSALTIAHNYNPAPPHPTTFKSPGTPSSPSAPSIPGKKSKYSKPPNSHPAFKTLAKPRLLPIIRNRIKEETLATQTPDFRIDDNGISYEMPEAPFLYQYSYTETPKVRPVKLREPLVSPFGPETMERPWLGRRPLQPSKKKLPEFDSFKLPPPHKKGVKPVQSPGPFLPGSGPKHVRSREEILGEPLTKEEIEALIESSRKSTRQLNMGRDGLTHNMLDNIHALWKRRRVCKIKCKGVCTVDMENVCQQLEEKSGGKIIYNRGGVIYLFRGRNYNYRTRPRFPLMLWKPAAPVYPRLVKRVPDGLTLEEASDLRKKGRDLTPICKLAKNGVYTHLVENVREAFEACEQVRINCQGLNPSDYRKIGAKLKDLVPCVLISFEHEHILVWRGPEWKSSIEPNLRVVEEVKTGTASAIPRAPSTSIPNSLSISEDKHDDLESTISPTYKDDKPQGDSVLSEAGVEDKPQGDNMFSEAGVEETMSFAPDISLITVDDRSEEAEACNQSDMELDGSVDSIAAVSLACTEEIIQLREQAVENGMAVMLDRDSLDADIVFKKAVALAKTAPEVPNYRQRAKELREEKKKLQQREDLGVKEAPVDIVAPKLTVRSRRGERVTKKMEDIKADYLNVVPQGNLRVDELAKLLS